MNKKYIIKWQKSVINFNDSTILNILISDFLCRIYKYGSFYLKSNDKKRNSICSGQWPKCPFYSSGLGSIRLVFERGSLEGDQNK